MKAERGEAEAERVGGVMHLGEMRRHFARRRVEIGEQAARKFQLPPRLERDRSLVAPIPALEPDHPAAIEDRRPAGALEPAENGADAVWLIGGGRQIGEAEAEFFVLGADPPSLARLGAGFEPRGELAPVGDGGGVDLTRIGHAAFVTFWCATGTAAREMGGRDQGGRGAA
jgi:hypothetical protein